MLLATVLPLLLAAEAPGPGDAFRLNYREVKASARFEYSLYILDSLPPASSHHTLPRGWRPGSKPKVTITGIWESDGTTEHLIIMPDGIVHGPSDPRERLDIKPFESLYDGKVFAYHRFNEQQFMMEVRKSDRPFMNLYGPFEWWNFPFPLFLDIECAGAKVTRSSLMYDGRPIEREVYRQSMGDGYMQVAMNYDPAIGHLPVYIRGFSFNPKSEAKRSNFKECYIVSARPCATGGFVPLEWIDTFFGVNSFDPESPKYTDDTRVEPADEVTLGHFRLMDLRNHQGQVAMNRLEDVKTIISFGGDVALPPGTNSMTLPQIVKQIGAKIQKSNRPERARLSTAAPKGSTTATAGTTVLFLLSFLGSIWSYRRWAKLGATLTLVAFVCSGCSPSAPSVPHLSSRFVKPAILYEANTSSLTLTLSVTNESNYRLKLLGANGGCSCRQLDQSEFPLLLRPKESHSIQMSYQSKGLLEPQAINIMFSTDTGNIPSRVDLLAMPKHSVSPKSVTLTGISEKDGDQRFELIYKEISEGDADLDPPQIVLPSAVALDKNDNNPREGTLDVAPAFKVKETTYRFLLKDNSVGSHRESIVFRSAEDGKLLLEVPVVWRRVPFLSHTPERVILGSKAIRVFLQCPDDTIELTQVVSSPRGVRAIVSSPRELTIQPIGVSPTLANGEEVVVATNAPDYPPLHIPFVRHAASADMR